MSDTQPAADSGQPDEPITAEVIDNFVAPTIEETNDIDPKPGQALVSTNALGGLPHLNDFLTLVSHIVRSDFVPKGLRGNEGATLACIMHGQEIGMRPMQALNSIDMIEGRPTLKPEAMRALILEAGHSIRFKERTDKICVIAVRRREWPAGEWEDHEYTIEEAKLAELTKKSNWQKMPKDMLIARATARAARAVFPDVIRGLSYIAEEIEAIPTTAGEPIPNVPNVESVQSETDPRRTMQVYYNQLDEQGARRLKKWWLDSKLPKGATWPAGTLLDLPEQYIESVINAIVTIGDGEVPAVLDFVEDEPEPPTDQDDDIVDAEIVEDEAGVGQRETTAGSDTTATAPESETADAGTEGAPPRDHASPDAESSTADTRSASDNGPDPILSEVPSPAPFESWHEALVDLRRENNIDPPTAKRIAQQMFGPQIKSVTRDLDEGQAWRLCLRLSSGDAFEGDITAEQAVDNLSAAFGDLEDVTPEEDQ